MPSARLRLTLALSLALFTAACSKTPQQWTAYGKAQAAAGEPLRAVAAFDKALAKPGPWTGQTLLEKARSLMALHRWAEAAQCAERSTLGQDAEDAYAARVLALQAWANANDKADGAEELARLGGAPAFRDPAVRQAALQLGLTGPSVAAASAKTPGRKGIPLGKLDAVRLGLGAVNRVSAVDPVEFRGASHFQDPRTTVKVTSPDGRWMVWRDHDKTGYWLFLQEHGAKTPFKMGGGKNGYQPVWSPDSKRILFSAMDWSLEERNLLIYNVATRSCRRAFTSAHRVGPLAAWSPDGSKIVFIYYDNLWVTNSTGIGRSQLDLASRIGHPLTDALVIGFNQAGDRLVYRSRDDATVYVVDLAAKI